MTLKTIPIALMREDWVRRTWEPDIRGRGWGPEILRDMNLSLWQSDMPSNLWEISLPEG